MKKEKTDQGFRMSYYGLTYRRKLIRTLWMIPISIILVVLFVLMGEHEIAGLYSGLMILTMLPQLYYNYSKWNKYERNQSK